MTPELEEKLAAINIREMFHQTRPELRLVVCQFGNYDCRKDWINVGTIEGNCQKLDPNHLPNYSQHNGLLLSYLMRKMDDQSNGWHSVCFYSNKYVPTTVFRTEGLLYIQRRWDKTPFYRPNTESHSIHF